MGRVRPTAFDLPFAVLREAQNQIISVETRQGVEYRGRLEQVSAQMNLSLSAVTVVTANGGRSQKSRVVVRGGSVLAVVLPEALEDAPQLSLLMEVKRAREEALRTKQAAVRKRSRTSGPVKEAPAQSGTAERVTPEANAKPLLKRTRVFLGDTDSTHQ
jgi:small nuclear ribonucleoprotein D3